MQHFLSGKAHFNFNSRLDEKANDYRRSYNTSMKIMKEKGTDLFYFVPLFADFNNIINYSVVDNSFYISQMDFLEIYFRNKRFEVTELR